MNAGGGLERAYRRQLAWYPAAHRRAHEEEMLGVLMTGAHTGQRRPGFAESADLIWGALRIRLRPARDGSAQAVWRDALAVVSVVLPMLFLVHFAASTAAFLGSAPPDDPRFLATFAPFLAGELACLVIMVALVLLRLRRTAALAAAALLIWYVTQAGLASSPNWSYFGPAAVIVVAALGLEIAALVASPGPRRGLQILTWKNYALVASTAAAAGSAGWMPVAALPLERATVITLVAFTLAGMALASRLSRRIMVLLSFPLYYLVLGYAVRPSIVYSLGSEASGWFGPLRLTLTFLPVTALLMLALAAAARAVRHTIPAHSQDA